VSGGYGDAPKATAASPLEFTGERFTPECVREIWYEHWHRYAFARSLAAGRRVLDAACGEGYGSDLLAEGAQSVVGVDISAQAIEHARERYGARANLEFEQGDCTALQFADAQFDLVVSFETLEHVAAQEALIAGFARVLKPDGVLLVSSPDKRTYSELQGFRNEFHVRELYRDELLALLRPHFPFVELYAQKLLFQSAIWSLDAASLRHCAVATSSGGALREGFAHAPLYYVAACAKLAAPASLPAVALFGDAEESVYRHYNGEVRRNMGAGQRIAELEAQLAAAVQERDRLAAAADDKPDATTKREATASHWPRWWPRRSR
jgi:SAM-dependent methyltransferase